MASLFRKRLGGPGAPSDTAVNPAPLSSAPTGGASRSQSFLPPPSEYQPTLPGMEHLRTNRMPPPQEMEPEFDSLKNYGGTDGAHHDGLPKDAWSDNPLYDRDAYDKTYAHLNDNADAGMTLEKTDTFVPPWQVSSSQRSVNPHAVEHQVQHANPLALDADPDMAAYVDPATGEDNYLVLDGNHRVNAAQQRGQLLMPATVQRYVGGETPAYKQGQNSVHRSR